MVRGITDETTRGILNPKTAETKFQLWRYAPDQALSPFIERYWILTWDLRGQEPHLQETLPFPCVNLVFERGDSRIFGVISGKFVRLLEGQGGVFGVKFKPGAFCPFLQSSVSQLTDRSICVEDLFGVESRTLEQALFAHHDHRAMIVLVDQFFSQRIPQCDPQIELINQIIDTVMADRAITRVDHVADRFNLSKRSLQRLFSYYVGVSPKWVIKRYRLQEAAEYLADGGVVDWPQIALDLGYFDQAHFINDFKTMIGTTPAAYARCASGTI